MNEYTREQTPPSSDIELADLVSFLIRAWRWVIFSAALCVGSTAILLLSVPRSWEASTLLLVNNPDKPAMFTPIPVAGYQRIIESGEVLSQIRTHAADNHLLDESGMRSLALGNGLQTVFGINKRDESATSPLIELKVTSDDPKVAAAIANYWANVSIAKVSDILITSYLPQIELADKSYQDAVGKLTARREQAQSALNTWRDLTFAAKDKNQPSPTDNVSISIPNSGLTEVVSYLDPELVSAKNLVVSLQQAHLDASQARVQFAHPALTIAVPAVEPSLPIERKIIQKCTIAGFAGAFLGLLFAGIRAVSRRKM